MILDKRGIIYRGTLGMSAYIYEKIQPFHDNPILQKFVCDNIKQFNVKSFCETGTFRGDTLKWVAQQYKGLQCYSIERFTHYYTLAKIKFRNYNNIHLLKGDSAILLNGLLSHIEQPILFWLDAHWGYSLPLENELNSIKNHNTKAVCMIDDIGSFYDDRLISKELIESVGFKVKMISDTVACFYNNITP